MSARASRWRNRQPMLHRPEPIGGGVALRCERGVSCTPHANKCRRIRSGAGQVAEIGTLAAGLIATSNPSAILQIPIAT